MIKRLVTPALLALAALLPATPALAHPHVWIVARAEVVYNADGRVASIRHTWTFDEAYSAFAVQGLDKNNDGKLSPEELQELADVNVESLHEFDFFTFARASGAKQEFAKATGGRLSYERAQLTLTFTLPLKTPAARRTFNMEMYDPTYFVSFQLAEGDDAVRLTNAPAGCARTITRPRQPDAQQLAAAQRLNEDFFASTAGANFGANFVNRVLVACP
jgi:ABC-type uncharacterized transport system substrate-binding protein